MLKRAHCCRDEEEVGETEASDKKVLLRSTRLVCRKRASAAALAVAVAVARAYRLFSNAARLRSRNAVPSRHPVVRAASVFNCWSISERADSLRSAASLGSGGSLQSVRCDESVLVAKSVSAV